MASNSRSIAAINVPLRTNLAPFEKGMREAGKVGEKGAKDIGQSLSKISFADTLKNLGLMGIGLDLIGKAASKSFDLLTSGFNRLKDLGKDAIEVGATATELSRLRNVAIATGTDFKDLTSLMGDLTTKINESIGRVDLQADSFKKLGTSAEELSKMTVADQLRKLNKGFNALPNDAEKARTAMALAGSVGIKNFKLLTASVDEFEKAYASGLIDTDADVSEAQKLQISIDKIANSVEKMVNAFTVGLLPALTKVADIAEGFASKFAGALGVTIKSTNLAGILGTDKAAPKGQQNVPKGPDPKVQAKLQDQAFRAQQRVAKLQSQADKQSLDLQNRGPMMRTGRNGRTMVDANHSRKDAHAKTMLELETAKREASAAKDAAMSQAEAKAAAMRMLQVNKEVANLANEYRESVNTSGMDDVHRRVAGIKGLSDNQRKQLTSMGYQAKEADRTSALRDELQESTKLPAQRLAEDLDRINRLVQLGAAKGGLTQEQGIRAAAMKTRESGLSDAPKFAGALQANSIEGRSYLLGQMNRTEDPVQVARQGLALTGQGNNLLGRILGSLESKRQMGIASY